MKDYTEELADFLETYVHTRSVSFMREDPRAFASRFSKVYSLFSFPYTEDSILEVVKEKILYTLWNFTIDDIIEYTDGGEDAISDDLQVLASSRKGKSLKARTEVGQILSDIIQRFYKLPLGPNREISGELIFLDLLRILNGFDYERIIHKNATMGTLSEYIEFGAVTADVRVLLDIDIAVYPQKLDLSTIGDLRQAYRWFGLAVKLSSDIATFEREYFVESSHNAVILLGEEKGLLPKNILRAERVRKDQLFEDVIPSVMDEIKEKAKKYLSKSVEYLDKITEIDTNDILDSFTSIFDEYPAYKDFSSPPNKQEKLDV